VVLLAPELDARLRGLTAGVMFSEATGRDLVEFACDLLVSGVEPDAAIELAGLPPAADMRDAEPIFRRLVSELGRPEMPKDQAGWALARRTAEQLLERSIPAHVGAGRLWGLWWDLGNPPEIAAFVQLLDAWEELLPDQRGAVEDEMRDLAPAVIEAADRATPD
jgi:hypothetical protein